MPFTKPEHTIPRAEWEERFKKHMQALLHLDSDETEIPDAELDSWPEVEDPPSEDVPDWQLWTPEEAAAESLSNWD